MQILFQTTQNLALHQQFEQCKGPVPLTHGLRIISITFTFVSQFGANLGVRILLS